MPRHLFILVPAPCWLIILLACIVLAGCSSSPDPVVKQEEAENLTKIGVAYDRATKQLGHPPQNPDQLKPFLKEYGDPESILRSPQDRLPYVILWGRSIRTTAIETMPPPLIAYEQQGVSGKRYVLTAMGIMRMTDEEFQKVNGNKKP
jgi:hypothetical protein